MANEEIGQTVEWAQQLRAVIEALEPLDGVLEDIHRWLWRNVVVHDCLPRELPDEIDRLLSRLGSGLHAGKSAASEAFQRFSGGPTGKFLAGMRLSEEEFYILNGIAVASSDFPRNTANGLGLTDVTDYEAFSMLYYEDDRRYGYINPEETPKKPGYFRWGLGIIPESVCTKFLRPEQDTFLRRRIPALFARVGIDTACFAITRKSKDPGQKIRGPYITYTTHFDSIVLRSFNSSRLV